MAECIFCEEEVSEDAEECPHCDKKPFSGMYFDPSTFDEAARLDEGGDPEGAWRILFEEWRQHTDHDYFDEEMAGKIRERIDALLDRNPGMIGRRIEIMKDDMLIDVFWSGGYDVSIAEEAMRLAREAGRPDLELEALGQHVSIQVTRHGGVYRDRPGLRETIEELERQVAEMGLQPSDEEGG